MAKCPKCNNQMPFLLKKTVKTKSGRPCYERCSNCQTILKPKFKNKALVATYYLLIFAGAVLALYKFPQAFGWYRLLLLAFVSYLAYYFFIEYEVVENFENDKQDENKY